MIKCVEEKNATEEELKITEVLTSHLIFKANQLFSYLDQVIPNPDDGEYYLVDVINMFIKDGLKVETLKTENYRELIGLNTPEELAWAEKILSKSSDQ